MAVHYIGSLTGARQGAGSAKRHDLISADGDGLHACLSLRMLKSAYGGGQTSRRFSEAGEQVLNADHA